MKNLTAVIACLLFLSCRHEILDPNGSQPPSNLVYSPASLQLKHSIAGSSVKPSINGAQPIYYTLATSPNSLGAITINGDGVISADASLAVGTYAVSITATNSGGGTAFSNVYQITVSDNVVAPSNLHYVTDTMTINEGDSLLTAPPTVNGTSPMAFSLVSAPADKRISINGQGSIKAAAGLPAGTYSIDVTAANSAGSVSFPKALTLVVKPVLSSSLSYAPNYLNLVSGTGGSSVVPTIAGSQPVSYTLSTSPATNNKITIDNTGKISVAGNLASGTYSVSVTATNAAGSVTFPNVFSVNVSNTATAPSGLSYSVNNLALTQGQTGNSVAPSINGTTPISFSLTTVPASGGNITINSGTGVISAGAGLAVGTYNVSVTATNTAGTAVFNNVYVITVNAAIAPSGLNYSPNSFSVTQGTAGTSVVPVISGSQPISYTLTCSPATTGVSINAQGVVASNSSLPAGAYTISVTATNAAGSTTFTNVYSIVVAAPAVTFTNDIKPLVISKCGNCHTGGGQTNYTIYTNAKTNISQILDRIQRTPGSPGFMPKNGAALTTSEINLFKQWQAQGLLQ